MSRIIRELYSEAGQVYRERLHRVIALSLIPLGAVLAYNNWTINQQPDVGCLSSCAADYTLVGVWMIIVPISLMALANYHLVMKPVLKRKNGKNGETQND